MIYRSGKVYDDFYNKKKQSFNEKLCAIRKIFNNYNDGRQNNDTSSRMKRIENSRNDEIPNKW